MCVNEPREKERRDRRRRCPGDVRSRSVQMILCERIIAIDRIELPEADERLVLHRVPDSHDNESPRILRRRETVLSQDRHARSDIHWISPPVVPHVLARLTVFIRLRFLPRLQRIPPNGNHEAEARSEREDERLHAHGYEARHACFELPRYNFQNPDYECRAIKEPVKNAEEDGGYAKATVVVPKPAYYPDRKADDNIDQNLGLPSHVAQCVLH
mmetsp:Transcript_1517/g.3629  ORF Transcript_1517/g.3629 Transcript_1517/m.3629 type:complete len:214 (+) Transcript_1517:735-1376(+)